LKKLKTFLERMNLLAVFALVVIGISMVSTMSQKDFEEHHKKLSAKLCVAGSGQPSKDKLKECVKCHKSLVPKDV